MAIPQFILDIREKIGHDPLWLPGVTLIVLRDGEHGVEVLLVRRSDNGQWTPVTGIVDPGEQPDVAARREALEETCIEVAIESLLGVQAVGPVSYPNGDVTSYMDTAFRARPVSTSQPRVGDDESVDVRWVPVDNLPPMKSRFTHLIQRAVEDRVHPLAAFWGPLGLESGE